MIPNQINDNKQITAVVDITKESLHFINSASSDEYEYVLFGDYIESDARSIEYKNGNIESNVVNN